MTAVERVLVGAIGLLLIAFGVRAVARREARIRVGWLPVGDDDPDDATWSVRGLAAVAVGSVGFALGAWLLVVVARASAT